MSTEHEAVLSVPGVKLSTTHIPLIAIDSPPESISTEDEHVISVPGVEVSTTHIPSIAIDSPLDSMSTDQEGVQSVPGVELSTTHSPPIAIDSLPESTSTEVLGVVVSTTSETRHEQAEIVINEKEGKWNESGEIDQSIMSITTSTEGLMELELLILPLASEKTVMHRIMEACPLLSFSLRESDYFVFSRKNENIEEHVKPEEYQGKPEEYQGKNVDGDGSSSILLERQKGTNISFKDDVLGICNAEQR